MSQELICEIRALREEIKTLRAEIGSAAKLGSIETRKFSGDEIASLVGKPASEEADPRNLFDLVSYDIKSIAFSHFPLARSTTIAAEILPARGLPFDTGTLQLTLSKALSPEQSRKLADRLSVVLLKTLQEWNSSPAS